MDDMKRPIFGDLLARIILLTVLLSAINASAAVHPEKQSLLIRPEMAKDAQTDKPRCIETRTIQRFRIGADGAITRVMNVTIIRDC